MVRQMLREAGFSGYRLHRKELPGKPDIAFIGRRKAIWVHGCFWHRHDCKTGRHEPQSNRDYWIPKFERNRQRDAANQAEMTRLGWAVLAVWECELKERQALKEKLARFLAPG